MTYNNTHARWNVVWASLLFIFLSATLSGIPLVVYTYIPLLSYLIPVLALGITWGLWPPIRALTCTHQNSADSVQLRSPYIVRFFIMYFFLFILALISLLRTAEGEHILSPWSSIRLGYVVLFFFIALGAYFSSFLSMSRKAFFVIALSFLFLQHMYIPLTYSQGFGGDRLRHVAIEKYLLAGNIYSPSLFGEPIRYARIGPLSIPEVFLVGNKTSYAAQWGITLTIHELTRIPLLVIDTWLVPLLWLFFVPLLTYLITRQLHASELVARMSVITTSLFYPLQVFGASTLPVSFYFPFFLGAAYLWLRYLDGTPRVKHLIGLCILTLSFYFGYILYLFLLCILALLVMLKKHTSSLYVVVGSVVSAVSLVLLEVLQDNSTLKDLSWQGVVMVPFDMIGRITSVTRYFASPTNIDQGNFIFNQTAAPLITLPLLAWKYWPIIVSLFVILLIVYAYRDMKRVMVFLGVLLTNYFISWYFLNGTHILSRRIDETVALLFSFCVASSVIYIYIHIPRLELPRKAILLSLLLTASTVMTYTSGPVLDEVTKDEFLQARVVWERARLTGAPYCVIGNTWPLLGLEYESSSRIVGGGFPLYKEYAQPERVKIFTALSSTPSLIYLTWAKRLTHASTCYYMTESRFLNDNVLLRTKKLLGEPLKIGETYTWSF